MEETEQKKKKFQNKQRSSNTPMIYDEFLDELVSTKPIKHKQTKSETIFQVLG